MDFDYKVKVWFNPSGRNMMNTKRMMEIALDLAGLTTTPVDSGIHVAGQDIKKVLIGIDMGTPELMLADKLGVDCVVSHHPTAGAQIVDFAKVMDVQIDKMVEFGVPINRAQKALRKKIDVLENALHSRNFDRPSSAARLLGMPYMNIHLPVDLVGQRLMQTYLNEKTEGQPKVTLKEVVEVIGAHEAYRDTLAKPVIRVGRPTDYAGKIAVLFAGGTNGGADVFEAYFDAGVGTIVAMSLPEDVKKAVEAQGIGNVVVAGHMASDSIGLNVLIESWERAGLEVIKMSGL